MKVKHINFKFELEGHGIVNYDSGDQKYLWNRESKDGNKNQFISGDNNNMYAKKHYYRDENGVLKYKIKISSDALRNAMFKNDAIATNPSIMHHKTLLNSFIGSTMGLIRGYMFAGNNETIKRKSPLTITSAIQSNNAESYMELHTRSGEKKTNNDSDTKDTSLFNKETIGDISYVGRGFIDIQGLEFISSDPVFDRYSFNSDDFEILKVFLQNNLPNFDSELGYYSLKTSAIDVAEYGIKLNKENILHLIKESLKRTFNISIGRAGSYAKLSRLSIQLVSDLVNPENNKWIEIGGIGDIDNLDFDIEEYYCLTDELEAKKQRELIEESLKESAKKKNDAKKQKK